MMHSAPPSRAIGQLYRQLGVCFARESLADITAIALRDVDAPAFYVTCNLNHLRVLQSDAGFREAYRKATIVTLDSRPVQMVSRIRFGDQPPLVTGADLFATLFERLRPGKDRPFFISSSDETGANLRQRLLDRGFAAAATVFSTPPFGFEKDANYSQAMVARILAHGTTHLFLGVGAPKSECWVTKHLDMLPPCHVFCVGAALDFTAGMKNRAPAWLGRLGLEWLHRLLSEPKRLLPRYVGDAAILARILLGQKMVRVSLNGMGNTGLPDK